jgi:uncharacterized protein YidB (DUF937 family)
MGLMDDLAGKAVSGLSGSSNSLVANLIQMIQSHPGGLSGLLQGFHENGLGDIVNSWISTGQNLPISSEQIQQALGSDKIKQLAAGAGISSDTVGSQLANLLPAIIDKLTPNGQIPQQSNFLEEGMNLLKQFTGSDAA